MSSLLESIERAELMKKLIDAGYGELVEALINNEKECFTKKFRLNKSGACRVLGWKTKQLEDTMLACRALLGDDIFDD